VTPPDLQQACKPPTSRQHETLKRRFRTAYNEYPRKNVWLMKSAPNLENLEHLETAWLTEAKHLANAVGMMSEAIEALSTKRETLEEKMIKTYFHKLSISCCLCIQRVHQIFQKDPLSFAGQSIEKLHALNQDLGAALCELLKVVRFNLNFLEQYFEFDFNAKLHNDFLFQERLEQVIGQLDEVAADL
jgi:hypothetical protein